MYPELRDGVEDNDEDTKPFLEVAPDIGCGHWGYVKPLIMALFLIAFSPLFSTYGLCRHAPATTR